MPTAAASSGSVELCQHVQVRPQSRKRESTTGKAPGGHHKRPLTGAGGIDAGPGGLGSRCRGRALGAWGGGAGVGSCCCTGHTRLGAIGTCLVTRAPSKRPLCFDAADSLPGAGSTVDTLEQGRGSGGRARRAGEPRRVTWRHPSLTAQACPLAHTPATRHMTYTPLLVARRRRCCAGCSSCRPATHRAGKKLRRRQGRVPAAQLHPPLKRVFRILRFTCTAHMRYGSDALPLLCPGPDTGLASGRCVRLWAGRTGGRVPPIRPKGKLHVALLWNHGVVYVVCRVARLALARLSV